MSDRNDVRVLYLWESAQKDAAECGLTLHKVGTIFEVRDGAETIYYPETTDDLNSFVYGYRLCLEKLKRRIEELKKPPSTATGL